MVSSLGIYSGFMTAKLVNMTSVTSYVRTSALSSRAPTGRATNKNNLKHYLKQIKKKKHPWSGEPEKKTLKKKILFFSFFLLFSDFFVFFLLFFFNFFLFVFIFIYVFLVVFMCNYLFLFFLFFLFFLVFSYFFLIFPPSQAQPK